MIKTFKVYKSENKTALTDKNGSKTEKKGVWLSEKRAEAFISKQKAGEYYIVTAYQVGNDKGNAEKDSEQ